MRGDPPSQRGIFGLRVRSTPHARGSTLDTPGQIIAVLVYPACAGIHPYLPKRKQTQVRLPRMRGDPPFDIQFIPDDITSTPHARGSTLIPSKGRYYIGVYPACAGIHLMIIVSAATKKCLPRMRGDPPLDRKGTASTNPSTPHARGSTFDTYHPPLQHLVYPACAGIHLFSLCCLTFHTSLPRMRGDPPLLPLGLPLSETSTPHARGSTPGTQNREPGTRVYPACAGIHLHLTHV